MAEIRMRARQLLQLLDTRFMLSQRTEAGAVEHMHIWDSRSGSFFMSSPIAVSSSLSHLMQRELGGFATLPVAIQSHLQHC